MNHTARSFFSARNAVAVLLLAHVLAVLILAASPRLHHWLHADADDDGHDCAVVLFLHGGGDTGPAPFIVPTVAGPVTEFNLAAPPTAFVPSVFAANGVFEHGPPLRG